MILWSFKALGYTDDHSACVFEYVHVFGFQDRNQHKTIGAFENHGRVSNRLEQSFPFVELYSNQDSYYFGVSLAPRCYSEVLPDHLL